MIKVLSSDWSMLRILASNWSILNILASDWSDCPQECRDALPSQDVECTEGPGLCAHLITLLSILLILASLPLSLVFVVKVSLVSSSDDFMR